MVIRKNKIEVLCPSKRCRKCTRIITTLEHLIVDENIDAEIVITDQLEELIQKKTWILPTILINDKIVARGYFPDKQNILEQLY